MEDGIKGRVNDGAEGRGRGAWPRMLVSLLEVVFNREKGGGVTAARRAL